MSITLRSPMLHGAVFAGSVSNGAQVVEMALEKWGVALKPTATLNASITVNEGEAGRNYAPHGVVMEGVVTGAFAGSELTDQYWDASIHRLTYVWDSGDVHAGDYLYSERLNIKDRRIGHGKTMTFVYRKPGVYTAQLIVYDQDGNWGTASVEITVNQALFSPDRTVVWAGDGDFDHAPYCVQANKAVTHAEVSALLLSITGTDPKVLYIKRGHVYDGLASQLLAVGWDVRAWGIGNKPVLKVNHGVAYAFNAPNCYFCIQDIDHTGDWDPVGEMFPTGQMKDYLSGWYDGGLLYCHGTTGTDVIVDRCDGRNMSCNGVYYASTTGRVIMHECQALASKEFMVFGAAPDGWVSIVGCNVEGDPDSSNGGLPRWFFNRSSSSTNDAGFYPMGAHNGYRTGDTRVVVAYGNNWFARHGWSVQDFDVFDTNPPIRLNTNGTGTLVNGQYATRPCKDGNRAEMHNNWFEAPVVASNATTGDGLMPTMQTVWSMNAFVSDPHVNYCLNLAGNGHTVRGNIFYKPDYLESAAMRQFVSVGHNSQNPARSRNEVYGNTIIDLSKEAEHHADFVPINLNSNAGFSENNVYYAPNRATPIIGDGPIDETLLSITPRFKGRRKSYEYWKDAHTLAADVPVGGSFVMAYQNGRLDTMTDAASFAGSFGKHRINITGVSQTDANGDVVLGTVEEKIAIAFEAGGIRITNQSEATWPSGGVVTAWLHRGTTLMPMDTRYAAPADSFPHGGVTAAAGAYGTATGMVPLLDLQGNPRRGSPHPDAPSGSPSKGAMEAV